MSTSEDNRAMTEQLAPHAMSEYLKHVKIERSFPLPRRIFPGLCLRIWLAVSHSCNRIIRILLAYLQRNYSESDRHPHSCNNYSTMITTTELLEILSLSNSPPPPATANRADPCEKPADNRHFWLQYHYRILYLLCAGIPLHAGYFSK